MHYHSQDTTVSGTSLPFAKGFALVIQVWTQLRLLLVTRFSSHSSCLFETLLT